MRLHCSYCARETAPRDPCDVLFEALSCLRHVHIPKSSRNLLCVLLQWLALGFPQDIWAMGNMVRLCSDQSTTESQACCLPVSIRPQYALEWDDRSCDVQQCAEHAWATGEGAEAWTVNRNMLPIYCWLRVLSRKQTRACTRF